VRLPLGRKENILPVLRVCGLVLLHSLWFGTFAFFLTLTGVLLVMKTLEDGWYIVMNAYKFTVFEIWRDFLHYHILRVFAIPTYSIHSCSPPALPYLHPYSYPPVHTHIETMNPKNSSSLAKMDSISCTLNIRVLET